MSIAPVANPGIMLKCISSAASSSLCKRDNGFCSANRQPCAGANKWTIQRFNNQTILFSFFHFCLIKSGAKIKASPNSRQDGVRSAKKFKVPRSAVLQIFLRSAHWSCYRELAKAGPLLSRIFGGKMFLHLWGWSLFFSSWHLVYSPGFQPGDYVKAHIRRCKQFSWKWEYGFCSATRQACAGANNLTIQQLFPSSIFYLLSSILFQKADPLLSGVFTNKAFLHIRSWFSFLIFHKRLLAPRGEVAQTGTCPAKCGSRRMREWDKAWNSAKGACLLW